MENFYKPDKAKPVTEAPKPRRVEYYSEDQFKGANLIRTVHIGWGVVGGEWGLILRAFRRREISCMLAFAPRCICTANSNLQSSQQLMSPKLCHFVILRLRDDANRNVNQSHTYTQQH